MQKEPGSGLFGTWHGWRWGMRFCLKGLNLRNCTSAGALWSLSWREECDLI